LIQRNEPPRVWGILRLLMALARPQRRIAAFLTLAAWLLALACTSVYACELALPAPTHD